MFALSMICAAFLLLTPAATVAAEPLIDLQMRDYFAAEQAQACLLNVAVAVGLLVTTPARVRERSEQIAHDPVAFKRAELARMTGVSTRFAWVEVIELAAIATGVGLVAWGELKSDPTMTGVGIGIAIEALLLLGLDFLADQRADRYLDALRGFAPVISQHATHLQWITRF